MSNLKLYAALFSLALLVAVSACCCCDDDDDGCADLIVQEIDLNSLNVECPGGSGTCVTTVSFTIANVGTANAGAFNVRIVLDPSASVVLNETVTGLAAGSTLTLSVMSPAGGNCYDPDCTTTVIVDSDNSVAECNENNNQDSRTRLG